MPVVAVAAAAASFTAGMAAVTAVGATLASTVIGGAMIVGGALTAIGTVTGNAKLAKIGGVLSLAGGVASLANSAINAASSTAGAVAGEAAADTIAGAVSEAGGSGLGYEGAVAAAEGATTEGVNLAGTESYALDSAGKSNMPVAQGAGDQAKGLLYSDKGYSGAAPAATPEAVPATQINAMDTGAASADAAANQTNAFSTQSFSDARFDAQNGMTPGGGLMDTMGGKFKEFQAWTKQNPELAKMLTEGVKGVAGNLVTSPKDQAMIDYYNANADKIKRNTLWASGRMA